MLTGGTSAPNGPDRVNDLLGQEIARSGRYSLTGRATALVGSALCQNLRTPDPVNGTIHSSTTGQGRIGRIDDSVDFLLCNVTLKHEQGGLFKLMLHPDLGSILPHPHQLFDHTPDRTEGTLRRNL